ncbi:MAG: hypothetical protein ILP12_07800 [Lachnospiraceae bacterium]|nr:hypothetical protein [Lachnospiraceae bacterium]
MWKAELQEIWSNILTWIAVSVGTVLSTLAFVFDLVGKTQRTKVLIPEHLTMLFRSGLGDLTLLLFLTVLAALPAAASWSYEKKAGSAALMLSRTSRGRLFGIKAVSTAVSAFLISAFPFLLNYLFCLIAIGRDGWVLVDYAGAESVYSSLFDQSIRRGLAQMLFPSLYLNRPAVNMLLHILLVGIYGSGAAVLTFSLSLFFRLTPFQTLVLPTVAVLVIEMLLSAFDKGAWIAADLLRLSSPSVGTESGVVLVVSLIVPFLISSILLWLKTRVFRDEL